MALTVIRAPAAVAESSASIIADNDNSSAATAPPLVTTTLVVENMHCGGCLSKVETALRSLDGVAIARANLSLKRVSVDHHATPAGAWPLIEALSAKGFRANELVVSETPEAGAANNDFLRRLAVAGFAAANIMLLSVSVWSGARGEMSAPVQALFHWLSALIALPAVAYAGQPFFRSALTALRGGRVNMDVPISLGVTLATAMSLYQTVRGSEQVYFDAAVTLLFFLLLGRSLDARVRSRAAGAAANLLGARLASATVIEADGQARQVSVRSLLPGMRVCTAAGERLAVDGRILEGASEIDESLITGETRPRMVMPGDAVYAGTINLGQPIVTQATATDEKTLAAEIARLMDAAGQARGRYVRLADRAARLYAPAVHILSLGTFLGWMFLGHGWEPALTAAIAVLIITCPCALALAVPAVQVAAVSRLLAKGVLVKSPDALERLAEVDHVVLDKTGTLTLGEPMLVADVAHTTDVLTSAAALAAASRHPYARAVVRAARARGLVIPALAEVAETAGLGLARRTPAGLEKLGSAHWCGVAPAERDDKDASLWFRSRSNELVAFEFVDQLRPDAAAVAAALNGAGLATELLSGDRSVEVKRIAAATGILQFSANLLPVDKLARLEHLATAGRKVLMIGDGLNDAPALAGAHASISPASAADISQTAADVVFQGEALAPVLETLAVARESTRLALQNFAIAVGYNIVFVPLAMAGLVTPLIAAVAMSASSIAVTLNAVRLRRRRLRLGQQEVTP